MLAQKCRDAPKDSTFEQLKFRAPAVVVPGNSTYRLCTQDQDCLDKNARCEASILRQQELEAAKIAKAGERYNAAMGSVGGGHWIAKPGSCVHGALHI